jgi:uncharacterized damage-inducible protein DinB
LNQAINSIISELELEGKTTRRLLERVPEEKLSWKPDQKSRSLGQLAFHIASIPGRISNLMLQDGFDASKANFEGPSAESKDQLITTLDKGVAEAKNILSELTEERAFAPWTMRSGEREMFTIPRIGVARNILLNHLYHHRGQLTVYLRLLNVPLPVVYGRTADENPFVQS